MNNYPVKQTRRTHACISACTFYIISSLLETIQMTNNTAAYFRPQKINAIKCFHFCYLIQNSQFARHELDVLNQSFSLQCLFIIHSNRRQDKDEFSVSTESDLNTGTSGLCGLLKKQAFLQSFAWERAQTHSLKPYTAAAKCFYAFFFITHKLPLSLSRV